MNDETLLKTVTNGLMIAGHEMGPVGDHWPAIHAVVKGVQSEFEAHDNRQAVIGEMEFYIADVLRKMEEACESAPAEKQAAIRQFTNEMWERYYAILEPVDAKHEPGNDDLLDDASCVKHMKSARQIISQLGGRA